METNILILSAGRRVELVKGFKEAIKNLNINGKVIAVGTDNLAPAIYFADEFYKVKPMDDENYIDEIINICNENNVKAIIPYIEKEVVIMSKYKAKIEKETEAKVVISDEEIVQICRNKIKTSEFLSKKGFNVPRTITEEDIKNKNYEFPLFIKPIDGAGSENAYKINNEEELIFFSKYIKNHIIQEFIPGQEHSVDIFADFDGNPIKILPKKTISIRNGNYTRFKTDRDELIIETMKKLLKEIKVVGDICVDYISHDNKVYIIEINIRIASDAPPNFKVGLDSPSYILRLISGEKLEYEENFQEDIIVMFYDTFICKHKSELKLMCSQD